MTPLAQRMAAELTLPKAQRTFDDRAGLLSLVGQDLHCFDVSAISNNVGKAMDESNLWPEIETMTPGLFLPSPTTWLEQIGPAGRRFAIVLQKIGDRFRLDTVHVANSGEMFSLALCDFRARSVLEAGEDRIEVIKRESAKEPAKFNDGAPSGLNIQEALGRARRQIDSRIGPTEEFNKGNAREKYNLLMASRQLIEFEVNKLEKRAEECATEVEKLQENQHVLGMLNSFIGISVLTLDLINTPGLVGIKQHDPHRGLVKQLSRVGSYPLRGWTEIVLKGGAIHARGDSSLTGPAFHKCLHFVRSHARCYQTGHIAIIPAHWRGDPALGIKRTRYRVEPASPVT